MASPFQGHASDLAKCCCNDRQREIMSKWGYWLELFSVHARSLSKPEKQGDGADFNTLFFILLAECLCLRLC